MLIPPLLNRLIPGAALLCLCGCSSIVNSHLQKEDLMTAYVAGEQDKVDEIAADFMSSTVDTGDELMWRLENGRNDFLAGRDAESFAHFTQAQVLMEDFDARAIINMREAAASGAMLLTNPNVLPYQGLCRDRMLFPVYMGLACLGQKDEEGFRVEMYHLREIQDKVIHDYAEYFEEEKKLIEAEKSSHSVAAAASSSIEKVLNDASNQDLQEAMNAAREVANKGYGNFLNPLTIFLSGYAYWRDGDNENAIVDFERLYKAMPNHPLSKRYYATALRMSNREMPEALQNEAPLDFAVGHDNVLVIFANGRSGAFKQFALYIPIIYAGYLNLVTVAWPLCEYYPAPFSSLTVSAGGHDYQTLPIADMDAILTEEYFERLPGTLTRLILSAAVKEIASYVAVAAADRAAGLGLAVALTTAAYKAVFNTADTRSWELLPKEYQIIQLPTPEDHTLTLTLPDLPPLTVTLSQEAPSAIIYVNAPSNRAEAFRCRVLEFYSK